MTGRCDYCETEDVEVRGTPFMADIPAKMCKHCSMKVVLVKADDWQGIFINGKLDYEGHRVTLSDLKEICKHNNIYLSDIEEKWVTDNYYDRYLSRYGGFPENLSEVELED